MIKLSDRYHRLRAPGTGRQVLQLTTGLAFCYPLYYFTPSITADAKYLIYHRAEDNQVQLHRLELESGESVQLTHASTPETQWWPWDSSAGSGVMDHLGVLNVARDEVIYYDGNEARAIAVGSLEDRALFRLPEDRIPYGDGCTSPDGRWYVYTHHSREALSKMKAARPAPHWSWYSRETTLAAYNQDTGEHRELLRMDAPIHHAQPLGERHLLSGGVCITDYVGGWYTRLRTPDARGRTCHAIVTMRGIAYEVLSPGGNLVGMIDPWTHESIEIPMPPEAGYTLNGRDLDFFERLKIPGQQGF
jgi:hypothetical protein